MFDAIYTRGFTVVDPSPHFLRVIRFQIQSSQQGECQADEDVDGCHGNQQTAEAAAAADRTSTGRHSCSCGRSGWTFASFDTRALLTSSLCSAKKTFFIIDLIHLKREQMTRWKSLSVDALLLATIIRKRLADIQARPIEGI